MSLYVEKDTLVHKMDPMSKIFYVVAVILIPLILPNMKIAISCLTINIFVLLLGRVLKKTIPIISFSFLILLSVVVIQGLFNQANKTPFLHIGPLVFYREGLFYAFEIILRVINILTAFAILVLTTKPSELIEALVRKGLSPRIGYVLSSVLQIIPQMIGTMGTITDAQRSRGMETEGKLIIRIKAFFPLIIPVVMSSIISVKERSMALEVRGFNAKARKTFLNEKNNNFYDAAIQLLLLVAVILAVIWRIVS